MIYGMYLSAQGADAKSVRLDVLSNNLANANTTSFKRDVPIFRMNPPFDAQQGGLNAPLPGDLENHTGGISLETIRTDFEPGSFITTDGDLDLAIQGQGFFQVGSGQDYFLTRNGSFSIDPDGLLVTADQGLPVLSVDEKEIEIPDGTTRIEFSTDGILTPFNANGQSLGSIAQVAVVMPSSLDELVKNGIGLYSTEGRITGVNDTVNIKQGTLEASGTNSIEEMMELVTTSRMFESNINMIKLQDDSLGRLLQSMPRR